MLSAIFIAALIYVGIALATFGYLAFLHPNATKFDALWAALWPVHWFGLLGFSIAHWNARRAARNVTFPDATFPDATFPDATFPDALPLALRDPQILGEIVYSLRSVVDYVVRTTSPEESEYDVEAIDRLGYALDDLLDHYEATGRGVAPTFVEIAASRAARREHELELEAFGTPTFEEKVADQRPGLA